jgi:hypoxanthine phosphoribosyltransferase
VAADAPEPLVVLDHSRLGEVLDTLATALDPHVDDDTVVVITLPGGLIFGSDLLRRLGASPVVDFVATAPYRPGSTASLVHRPATPLEGAKVLLLTDVIDTGLSLTYVLGELERAGPSEVRTCALFDKPHRRLVPVRIDHVGVAVEHDFVVGYGLDFGGWYRNLPVVAAADLERLSADPTCYRHWAYGNRG